MITYGETVDEAIDMAKTASEKVTVALYKETKLKEPLVIDNPKAPMVLDIHGQEVSGEGDRRDEGRGSGGL